MERKKLKINKKIIISFACFLLLIVAVVVSVIIVKMVNKRKEMEKDTFSYAGFFVEYFNSGVGDCTMIHFDNGKIMLIDVGYLQSTLKSVEYTMEKLGKEKIDYLVLTHPDNAHIGNTLSLLDEYEISTCFVPDLKDDAPFVEFNNIKSQLKLSNVVVKTSTSGISPMGSSFSEGDANVYFLYPKSKVDGEIYADICLDISPTEEHIDNLSPVIFIEYQGARFLFCGDCRQNIEEVITDRIKTNYYNLLFSTTLNFDKIDFLLAPSHGANVSNSEDFLNEIMAENVIISAEGSGGKDSVSTAVINRIYDANSDVSIYITQQVGTIRVGVDKNGNSNIVADKDLNN